jgi:WS/DGAT/MGAT family acyltransferase
MHVGGLMLVDPSTADVPYSFESYRDYVAARLPRLPAFRRKLATVPLNLGRPLWVEDSDFDLDFHVHRTTVAPPGGDHETADVVADILSRSMDRSRPLWEMWVVEGREDGLIAVVSKVHHSTIDGITGANMLAELFDLEASPPPAAPVADDWEPERRPSDVRLVANAVLDMAGRPLGVAKLVPGAVLSVGKLAHRRGRGAAGMPAPFRAPRTSFNATITAHRTVAYTSVPLADIKTIKNAFDVKVNDVVTAICSGALRHYLADRDELPERSLIAAIPISVHDRTDELEGTTKVSIMFSSLASDIDDVGERLRYIATTNEGAKEDHELVGASTLQSWAEHAAPNTFSLASRVYSGLRLADRHPVVHNLVISNVPGPPLPLYFNGAKLARLHPLGPIMDGAGLNITVLSYLDEIGFGLISCRELMPEIWSLADAVPGAVAELLAAADELEIRKNGGVKPLERAIAPRTTKRAAAKKPAAKGAGRRRAATG